MQDQEGDGYGVLDLLVEWAVSNRAFTRNKVGVRKKVLAAVLASSGVPYREVASLVGSMTYVAARDCHLRISRLLPPPVKSFRRCVAIDETVTAISGLPAFLWLARDLDTGQTLSFRCSFNGSPEDSAAFAQSVLHLCSNRPMVRLGKGTNRPRALKNLDFYFQPEAGTGVIQIIQKFLRLGSR